MNFQIDALIDYKCVKLYGFSLFLIASSVSAEKIKNLVDYFLPMEPVGQLISNEIWGNFNVLPRDIQNGLEDPTMKSWCYWDGRIVKDDEGKYHIYCSRWDQVFAHNEGWTKGSVGIHAVAESFMGPYVDQGKVYPNWNDGKGHNVMGLRMRDGRWAVVSSEITKGDIFVSENPWGPFEHLGEIKWEANGFDPGLAAYNGGTGNMANVQIILRPDGRYMLVARSTAVMISEDDILGPYKIMTDRMYKAYPELPQSKNEDPTLWYSGGRYHIVYNHWPSKTSYHFSSEDGIHDWVYRGIAFKKDETKIFRYTDGTENDWEFIERPTAYVENGHVKCFIFSVIDVHKGEDLGGDNHGSKIVVVPFDGESFDRDMQSIVDAENRRSLKDH